VREGREGGSVRVCACVCVCVCMSVGVFMCVYACQVAA
jgi:hypothetical protein